MRYMRYTPFYKDGKQVKEYTIKNEYMKLSVINFGAAITRLVLNNGKDVVLGFQDYSDYFLNDGNLGVVVVPNGNRIARSELQLDGKTVFLEVNNHMNNLHSHSKRAGQKQFWNVTMDENQIVLTTTLSTDVDYFPGNREYRVLYRLDGPNLVIEYECLSDAKTIFNPTQHTYFNLDGQQSSSVLNHQLQIKASTYTQTDAQLIPTGQLVDVTNTAFDFREPRIIGQHIKDDEVALRYGNGYDHNFCFDDYDGTLKEVGYLKNEDTLMRIYTDMPGMQVYTGNFLANQLGKNGAYYQPYQAVALETQYYPDCIHHPDFPSSVLEANTVGKHTTIYRFEVID